MFRKAQRRQDQGRVPLLPSVVPGACLHLLFFGLWRRIFDFLVFRPCIFGLDCIFDFFIIYFFNYRDTLARIEGIADGFAPSWERHLAGP